MENGSFSAKAISAEILEILGKHGVRICDVDIVFAAVKEKLSEQVIAREKP